ncbi:hypothetical protein ACGS9J_12485 [Serratia quinivorans]|uniref:hypothetical protein n=1 Tax=Serratia quinivorans TaxID=137545 RepID=UPI003F98DD4D
MIFIAKLHADEVDIDLHLVTTMLASQFPQWATLAITPPGGVAGSGGCRWMWMRITSKRFCAGADFALSD